jgi:hypothetical protein
MQKISIGLSACLLLAVANKPSAAEDAVIGAVAPPAACTEYFECLEYGTLSPEEARKVRGHPQFVEPTAAPSRDVGSASARLDRASSPSATLRQ